MIRFLILRTLQGILVLWLITIAVFGLFYVVPSNVARTLAGRQATPQTIASINHRLGLDQPILTQYWHFISNAFHGDLGYDYYHQIPVTHIIAQAMPITLSLALGAAVIWMALGVFNGVVSAIHPRSIADRSLTVFALFFYSMPSFFLGLILIQVFAISLPIFNFEASQSTNVWVVMGDWYSMTLPIMTLALITVAAFSRYMRSSAMDVLAQDYIKVARAKGLPERLVLWRHLVRNASLPMVTLIGLSLPILLAGNLITETLFNYQGLGLLFFTSLQKVDYPVLLAYTLAGAVLVVVGNLIADIALTVADPRIRLA